MVEMKKKISSRIRKFLLRTGIIALPLFTEKKNIVAFLPVMYIDVCAHIHLYVYYFGFVLTTQGKEHVFIKKKGKEHEVS